MQHLPAVAKELGRCLSHTNAPLRSSLAIPLQEVNGLWLSRQTGFSHSEMIQNLNIYDPVELKISDLLRINLFSDFTSFARSNRMTRDVP